MKKKKRLSLLFLTILLIIGVCGCMSGNKMNKAEEMKELALKYLSENYNDTFTALGYSDGDWAYDYSSVNFTSDKYSESVEVRIYEENGNYSFKDNYFKLTMREDAEKYFKTVSSKYGYSTEVKVRFVSPEIPGNIANNATFAEYVATEQCNVEVYFITASDFAESDVKAILADIGTARIMGFFRFVVTNDADLLRQYSIGEIVNQKQESVLKKQSFMINNSFEVIE